MAKAPRALYRCDNCGYERERYFGLCSKCQKGTGQAVTRPAERAGQSARTGPVPAAEFHDLATVDATSHERTASGIEELDRVLGGGLVPGSYLVLAGEPGAGKTTLATQLLITLSAAGQKVALVSGEESEAQARMRFERLGAQFKKQELPISSETSIERICEAIPQQGFDLIVIDSIQTMFSEAVPGIPGSVSQVRECAHQLMRVAKETGTSVLLVGQVTKDGDMAGPRTLEHLVDVVMAFEGDRREQLRILRAVKNRFGTTDEIGVFEMTGSGLMGVADASAAFTQERAKSIPGVVVCAAMEGTRPVLCEIQALVETSNLPQPIRANNGLDAKRVQMLLAVLSRKCSYPLGSMNVFLNVSGGLKVSEPAGDLAICLAVASALEGRPVDDHICAFGEVSLTGEVRPASQADRRAREAERLGYRSLDISADALKQIIGGALSNERVEDSLDQEDL